MMSKFGDKTRDKMELPINQVVCGDCVEVMGKWPDGCIDAVITDPPWFVSQQVTIHRQMNPKKYSKKIPDGRYDKDGKWKYRGRDINLDFGPWDHFESEEDYWNFTEAWLKEATRVLKPRGHLITFFDQNRISRLIDYARGLDMKMRQHLYWLKTNPVPRARKVDFMVALEAAVWFTKSTKSGATFNYQLGQQRNYVESPIPGHTTKEDGGRDHPTQKPVKVLKVWISYLTNESDIVVDPLCGCGPTLMAAKKLGRRYIGIDIEPKYVEVSKRRLSSVETPLTEWIR